MIRGWVVGMELGEFVVFVLAIPFGYFFEFVFAYAYTALTACKINIFKNPANIAYITVSIIMLAFLVYLKPTFAVIAGMLVGGAYRFGVDYGEWFERLDEIKLECLYERYKQNEDCVRCFDSCLATCKKEDSEGVA